MADTLLEEQRENWGSRTGFVLAAIGSAVGLGNLWGFPYKLYSFGGGAFLIPYLIAMVLIGIPLLIAEFSLGHLTQRATPDAFGRVNRRFAFVGWWQIILSFVIITYYAVILAWCFSFLYYSVLGIFRGALPWAGHGLQGVENAKKFFFSEYLHFNESFALGRLQVHIIVALVITWVAMYFCIFRGVRLVGKVVMWTVPLPWIMLLILTIRGLTLEGAVQGLEYYLEPNFSRLANPTTWRWAFGQMFFSMSLAFGIMITYASFLHRKSDLNNNAVITGLADMGTSFVAGLAVFATLGGMAFATAAAGEAVPVDKVADVGPSLAFVAFPYALAQLPLAPWFSALFFASLLLLGIDSAFSITECVLASVVDKTGWSRGKVLIGVTLVGLAIGLVFCTQGGLSWLGSFDEFINGTWGITLTALLECFVLGWLFRLRRLREHANERSDWKVGRWWEWAVRFVIPVVLAGLFAWSLFDGLSNPSGYARTYAPAPVSVQIPAARKLPERPVLQVQFVADFSGQPEHTFTLDEAEAAREDEKKAAESVKGWRVFTNGQAEPVKAKFKAAELIGRPLVLKTDAVTPATAYTVRCRWTSAPQKDPRTQLPVPVPEARQPKWTRLGQLVTSRELVGIHAGNTAGLILMAAAPVLAIVIAAIRFRRHRDEPIRHAYSDSQPQGKGLGSLATALGLVGVAAAVLAFRHMLTASANVRAGAPIDTTVDMGAAAAFLVHGGGAALVGLLLGGGTVLRLERKLIKASMSCRLAGVLGVLGLGLVAGLGLALSMLAKSLPATPIEYDNQLSGISYLILAGMLALIVVGLGWCFYRAIKAIGGPEEQPAEGTEGA